MLTRLLFPSHCIICKRYGYLLCPQCKSNIPLTIPECYRCRKLSQGALTHSKCLQTSSPIIRVTVLFNYWEHYRRLITHYKYKQTKSLEPTLSQLVSERVQSLVLKEYYKGYTIVPIPLSPQKQRERGFNQSLIIANTVSSYLNSPVTPLLHRPHTTSQVGKDKADREGAAIVFTSETANIPKLLLVDDVLTTGSTLNKAAMAIKSINPNIEISALVMFRSAYRGKKEGPNDPSS